MANEPMAVVVGNLARDPEVRFTPGGDAVCSFTVASTPRTKRDGQWEDGETWWVRCTAWRDLGEHVGESLRKGDRVIVQGRLAQRTWTDKEGVDHSNVEMTADEVGASLRFCDVATRKAARTGGGNRGGDPWETEPATAGVGGRSEDPPF